MPSARALRRASSRPVLSVSVACLSLALAGRPAAQPASPPDEGDLLVTAGEAVIKAAPDQAFVTVTAESRARTPREAQLQNAQAMSAVQQRLKGVGVPAGAIRTLAYDLQAEFDYHEGKQTLRGYVARNSLEVRLDEVEKVGEVIDASVMSGATSVSDVRFDLKDRGALEREALKQAVGDARGRVEALAAAAGRAIDRIVRVEDAGAIVQPPPRPVMMMRAEVAAAPPPETPVVPGQVEVRARVSLTARMK